jgi:hypothetical protein
MVPTKKFVPKPPCCNPTLLKFIMLPFALMVAQLVQIFALIPYFSLAFISILPFYFVVHNLNSYQQEICGVVCVGTICRFV